MYLFFMFLPASFAVALFLGQLRFKPKKLYLIGAFVVYLILVFVLGVYVASTSEISYVEYADVDKNAIDVYDPEVIARESEAATNQLHFIIAAMLSAVALPVPAYLIGRRLAKITNRTVSLWATAGVALICTPVFYFIQLVCLIVFSSLGCTGDSYNGCPL